MLVVPEHPELGVEVGIEGLTAFLGGPGYFVALGAALAAALLLGHRRAGGACAPAVRALPEAACPGGTVASPNAAVEAAAAGAGPVDDRSRRVRDVAAGMLVVAAVWVPASLLFSAGGLPARLWMGPLDRLLVTIGLLVVGWSVFGNADGRRARRLLALGLALALAAYAGCAPVWARGLHAQSGPTADPTGVAGAWDAARLALALGLTVLLARGTRRRSDGVLVFVVCLGLGSLLDLVAPGQQSFAVWSRLSMLAGGLALVGSAAVDAPSLRWQPGGGESRSRSKRLLRLLERARPTERSGARRPGWRVGTGRAARGWTASSADPAVDAAIELALRQAADSLAARPVFVAMLTERGDLDLRGLASASASPLDLGTLPLDGHPTLSQALDQGRLMLESSHLTADLDRVFARVCSLPVGPAMLVRIGDGRPYGVLAAGRRRGAWEEPHAAALVEIAARAAASLEARDRQARMAGETARAMGALDAQGAAIGRLSSSVEDLDRRLSRVEFRVAGLPTAALDAGHLVRPAATRPTSDVPASDEHWNACEPAAADGPGDAVTASEEAPCAVGVDVAAAAAASLGAELLPRVAESLRAPISSIRGYHDLLTRGDGLESEQLGRFLERIDANLSRMQVMLGNLAAIGELDAADDPEPQPLDASRLLRRAAELAAPQLAEKGLRLELDIAPAVPDALAEPDAVERIVDNLLVNAVVRSPHGGDIRATLRAVGSDGGGCYVVLSVRDRGRVPCEATGTVLEVDEGDEASVALRLVRLLAVRQGGRAWVDADTAGATFHVRLPAVHEGSDEG